MLVKFYARRDIKRCIKQGEQFLKQLPNSDNVIEFKQIHRWRDRSVHTICIWFGSDHFLTVDIGKENIVSPGAEWRKYNDDHSREIGLRESYLNNIPRIMGLLKEALNEIAESGLTKYGAANIVSLPAAIIAVLTLTWGIVSWTANRLEKKTNDMVAESVGTHYKVTEVEFYHWYRNLRWQYQHGLDSVAEDVRRTASRGLVHSMTLKKWLEYAEKFEQQIDKTLDSFLMEYAIQGGDTLTLNYKRKPLGNLSQNLRNSPAYRR